MQFGDSSDCMMRLMDLGNYHKSKEGVFEMTADNGGRLETLHWSGPFSKSIASSYSDFLLSDYIHKTNMYNLSLIVTTIVDSLGKSVPIGFLVVPSEYSDSITRHMKLLKLTRTDCCDPSLI